MCGFKRSATTPGNVTGGFQVARDGQDGCLVAWRESLENTTHRLLLHRAQSVTELPRHSDQEEFLKVYADALNERWDIKTERNSIFVRQKPSMNLCAYSNDRARAVRQVITIAGGELMGASSPLTVRRGIAVTSEHTHVRVMVRPWWGYAPWDTEDLEKANGIILDALNRHWETNSWDSIEGLVIKVGRRK